MDNFQQGMQEPEHDNLTDYYHSLMHVLTGIEHPTVTFADIVGFDDAKRDMQDVVDFLKMPQRPEQLEKKISKGVMLVGFPGRERRLLVEAVAGEVGIALISLSFSGLVAAFAASDDYIKYIKGSSPSTGASIQGIPTKRGIELTRGILQHFFFRAKRKSPRLFLVDDVDAIARLSTAVGREQLLNQLFVEIDGLVECQRSVVVVTASHLDAISQRLLRSDYFKFRVLMNGNIYLRQGENSIDKEKKKIALSIKRAEVDPWTTVEQRYTPGQVVTGVITRIAPFGAFARIEDGIEGLIHLSEHTPGMDAKQTLYEGQHLQLRILRIDAERRRLGLSLWQADEADLQEPSEEQIGTTNLCPSCQREVQPDWKHCMFCGSSLARMCPNCGAPRVGLEGARFCFECGSQLE